MTDMPQHRAPCSRAALAGLVLFALIVCPACSTAGSADTSGVAPEPAAGAADIEQALDTSLEVLASAHSSDIDNALLSQVTAPWIGDFDDMVERRMIRVLVVYSGTFYFLDGAMQKGITYEAIQMFEKQINERLGSGTLKVQVILLPVRRDQLIPYLLEGKGDIAASNLTIIPERLELVDFSVPAYSNVDEVVVTGPAGPEIDSVDDLAGLEINVRQSSSYWSSLQRLNERFRAEGKPEMTLTPASEVLEDEDLLQMVNASLLPLVVVDSHKAKFWEEVFTYMTVHYDVAVNTGGQIGWAFRKNSPALAAEINEFIRGHKQGTLLGNILLKRYLQSGKYVENVFANRGQERFEETVDFFIHYAGEYDFPYLMVAAQAYQESRLDHSLVSPVGAVGVMQLLPSTAADPNVGIPDIHELEDNIHAGVKYLRFIADRYFSDPAIDEFNRALFSFAAYNAGPARINRLRRAAEEVGLDRNE